jgi:hypothetical protein
MPGSGGGGSQTTRVDLPKWQQPFVEHGFEGAQSLYDQGGTQVAGTNDNQAQGYAQIRGTALNNGLNTAATGLATNTLNGGFLGSNPHLNAQFEQARLATQGGLASEFAGRGRNVEASEGLRSQQLNDLATRIYGGNYQAERDRMQSTLGMSPGLNASQFTSGNALLGIGGQQQAQQQAQLNQRGNSIDEYLQRVSGSYGNVTQQPMSGNRAGNMLGMGMLGSQMGQGYGQYGSMIGGGLGMLGGYYM